MYANKNLQFFLNHSYNCMGHLHYVSKLHHLKALAPYQPSYSGHEFRGGESIWLHIAIYHAGATSIEIPLRDIDEVGYVIADDA